MCEIKLALNGGLLDGLFVAASKVYSIVRDIEFGSHDEFVRINEHIFRGELKAKGFGFRIGDAVFRNTFGQFRPFDDRRDEKFVPAMVVIVKNGRFLLHHNFTRQQWECAGGGWEDGFLALLALIGHLYLGSRIRSGSILFNMMRMFEQLG